MENFTKDNFLELFNKIKSEKEGFESNHKILNKEALGKLKSLKSLDFGKEHFEKAIKQMFSGDISFILEKGLNTPIHILRHNNFERYLTAYENAEKLKEIKKAELLEKSQNKNDPVIIETKQPFAPLTEKEKQYELELVEKAKLIYTESLSFNRWLGGIMDAVRIGDFFSKSFTDEEKRQFKKDGEIESENTKEKRTNSYESLTSMTDRIARTYWRHAMYELAIKEAVKRKIKEPWK